MLQLPSTLGATTPPALSDYAIAAIPSNAACAGTFSAGYASGVSICLARVDITTLINPTLAPRGGAGYGTHEISPANLPAGAVTFYTLP